MTFFLTLSFNLALTYCCQYTIKLIKKRNIATCMTTGE